MTLEDRLERLANRTPPGDPADVLAAARARAESGSRHRPGRSRLLAAAAAVVAVVALAAGGMAVLGDGSESADVATGPDSPAPAVPNDSPSHGAERPTVSVEATGLPTVNVSTSPLRPSAASESNGWLDHTVTMANTGPDPVHLNDFRTGTVLGDREVLAATDGCGYGGGAGEPVTPGCRSSHQPVTIEPGGSHEFDITLWRDLAGMNPVSTGTYRWDLGLLVGDAPFTPPRTPGGKVATLTVIYDALADKRGADKPDDRGGDAIGLRVLPGWVPDGYRLAWVDTPAIPPSDTDRFAPHERPHHYAYGYQNPGAAELEVRVMVGASIGDPETVAGEWNRLAAPTTVGGRPAVGYTDDGGYTQMLVEVDGGVAMISTHPLGESYPDGRNPAMPPRSDVDRFAASIAGVSDADWDAALSSGADVASTFGPKDGVPVVDGDGWSLMHGDLRAPVSVRNPALWVDFGGATGGAAGPGFLGEDGPWHAAIAVHDSTRVAWGILPADAESVEVTIGGEMHTAGTVALADTAGRAFAVDVSRSAGNGTFQATDPSGRHVASGPIDTE